MLLTTTFRNLIPLTAETIIYSFCSHNAPETGKQSINLSEGNDVYLTDSIVLGFFQQLDVSLTAQGRDQLIHQREIKGAQKLWLSVMAHKKTN